jgi:putative PEP-CTERM system TPR-repeat lipoprotein
VLLVLAHLKSKEFEQALEASKRLEQRHADSPVSYNLTGLALMAKGDFPAARERFEKALTVDPRFVTAEINLARLDLAGDDLDGAQRRYERVLEADPKHLGALLGVAALADQRGDADALVAALERAQDTNPTATQPGLLLARFYLTQGDYLKALTVASNLAGRFPDNEPILQMLARAQTLGGQVPNAIRTLDQLLAKNPKDPQLHYLAGGARWKGQDFAGAQLSFRTALQLKPDFADAQVALASVSLDAGDTESAMKAAKALQTDFPDTPVGYRVEGSIHTAKHEYAKAAESFKAAYSREKSSVLARQLAETLNQAGQTKEAVEVLQGWAADNPKDLDARAMLGLYLQQAGRSTDAIAVYEQVSSQAEKKNPLLLNNLAWLYHEEGDPRAQAVAKEAYELAPSRPEIADTYGWILYNVGQREQGLQILQQAYLAFPTQTEIGYHVAVALEGLGRTDESIQILRKILRENPNSEQAEDATQLLKKLGG